MSTLCSTVTSIAQAKRRGLTSSAGALGAKAADKKPRYAFGKKSGDGVEAVFVCPKERFETNIPSGQRASDIEPRRKRTGFNKLTAEKTNIFVQSIGYFRALSSMVIMELTVCLAAGPHDWILIRCHRRYPVPQASLKGDIAMKVTVFRAGQEQETLLLVEALETIDIAHNDLAGFHGSTFRW
ncbi:hypothetical protein CBS147352_9741 [Aspergillus niger]|nr:hypothetical protein CBS147324_9650 [Aspergillus niger]KAI3040872.1 hypothetical protein CBS147352_9741 [Aspergillus niger]